MVSEERKALLIGLACAFFVTSIAVGLDGIGSHFWNDFRWFIAGASCAAMVIDVWAFRRNMRIEQQWQASKDRVTAELADAVQREMKKRGTEDEDKPPFSLH